jgi:signal peptidase II
MKFLAAIALPLYALDQLTKWWIYTHFALVPSERNVALFPETVAKTAHLPLEYGVVPGWFQIVHWGNTGAAFSMLSDYPWIFIVLSIAAFFGLLIAWKKNVFTDAPSRLAVPLILAGILGNVTDRLVHGYVVDFILVDLHVRFADPWPAFNVADSCIFIAAALFIVAAILDAKRKKADGPA